MPEVVAIIVNWNGSEDTLSCLEALSDSQPPPDRLIVVDNGSSDDSVAGIHAAFPVVTVIELPENRHFAAGANAGMSKALQAGARIIWLLNNDTRPAPGALAEMRRVLDSDPAIGIVGARLVHPGRREVIGAICDFRTGAIVEPLPNPAYDRLPVDYVWGASMLIRAEVLEEVGLFDESYIAYFEDADLCLRARRAGWLTVGATRAEVQHIGSKSANRRFLQQMILRGCNWARFFLHYSPDRSRLVWWLVGWRLPHLAWSTLFTFVVRTLRPGDQPLKLWSAD